MSNDLISREAVLEILRAERAVAEARSETLNAAVDNGPDYQEGRYSALGEAILDIEKLSAVRPKIVANITGGLLQGASVTHLIDLYVLDFDVDTFDEDSCGIEVEGSKAYLYQETGKIDPDFIREVEEAPEINFATGEPVDA